MSGYLRPFDEVIEEHVNAERDRLTAERDEAREEAARLRGVVEAVRALPDKFRHMDYRLAAQLLEQALASVPSSGETGERARRYDQCDGTCTTDCGHCKGQGRPASEPTVSASAATEMIAAAARLASPEPTGADDEHLFVRDLRRHPNGEVRLYVDGRLVSGTFAQQVLPALAARPVLSRQALAQALADDDALRFTDKDIENANAAMGEGEWQWFQWLLREKVRALAAVLDTQEAGR